MNKLNIVRQNKSTDFLPPVQSSLQRKCACGNHTVAGGECAECAKNNSSLQRQFAINAKNVAPEAQVDGMSKHVSTEQQSWNARSVKVPAAPVNNFDDCPVDWQRKANAALIIARNWVGNVVTGLANLPYPYPVPVANLLKRHFQITGRGYVYEVLRRFNIINSALNSPIDFECETDCDANVAAYVYSVWSDVHLCPVWYSLSPEGRANTIIHEIAHDAANCDDEAYIWEAKYSKLPVADAVDNADSYSNFAQEAY